MTYYAKQMENGAVVALHTMDRPFTGNAAFVPITEAEYTALLADWGGVAAGTRADGRNQR